MKYAVHCPTQQDYDTLMQAYEKKGWLWLSGKKPTAKNNWPQYSTETIVDLHDEHKFGDLTWFKNDSGYTIITLKEALAKLNMPRTIEQVQKGDLLKMDFCFYRVFDVRGNGELALVDLSSSGREVTSDSLKIYCNTYTIFELEEKGFTIYEPEETTEVLGKKYKTSELTDRLKELKEVE